MRVLRSIFEDEDILAIESKVGGKLRKEGEWVDFTTEEWGVMGNRFINEGAMDLDLQKKWVLIQGCSGIVELAKGVKSVQEKASLLGAAMNLTAIDLIVGSKMVEFVMKINT